MPMDFFSEQDAAHRRTWLLVTYFVLAMIVMIAALYIVAVAITPVAAGAEPGAEIQWFRPDILLITALVVGGIVGLGSAYKIMELRGGGETVAGMLGGRRLNPNATDLAERRLLNVVEEMAVASGIPVPPVYVLDNERSINAFAAGYNPGDAVIGVSRGAVEYLSRDELQGVIAHEFSHILHGDMRLNIRLIGILHGILLIAVIGFYLLRTGAYAGMGRSRNRRDSGGGYLLILGLAALVIGSIGLFFARLIKAAVSRQREYLADASAVQFTRNPDGIGGALKKIGGLSEGSKLEAAEAETVSHMVFAHGSGSSLFGLLATHPPLTERIKRIDPHFDGRFPKVQAQPKSEPAAARKPSPAQRPRFGTPMSQTPLGQTPLGRAFPMDPALLLGAIGTPTSGSVAYSRELIDAMPDRLRDALHDLFSARCVVFALLLEGGGEIREKQLELLRDDEGDPTRKETELLEPLVHEAGRAARLPLIEMVQSSLVNLSPEQYQRFRQTVGRLVQADGKISLFEFVLQQVLMERLARHILNMRTPPVKYHALSVLQPEIVGLISCLAHIGSPDPAEASRAFQAAMSELFPASRLLARADCSVRVVHQALQKLAQGSPAIKKKVLSAAVICVAADGKVTVEEAELLRTIADSLDCPMPPISAGPIPAMA
jgi:Zn-dependent protease with chaperone function